MKTFFQKEVVDELVNRIGTLGPDSRGHWGRMNISQMLAHCSVTLETATGEKFYPQVLIGRVIGRFFKSSFLNDAPMKRNGPTNKAFVISNPAKYEEEKDKLLTLINKFYSGGEDGCTTNTHSFFGKLTKEEWARLMYKHINHHLQQFGV